MDVKVSAAKQIRGSVRTGGDKSVSHRYAMLAGIAEGTSEFENFSSSADCASTLGCMEVSGLASGVTAATSKWTELAARCWLLRGSLTAEIAAQPCEC
jgi:5-enolpyruvylshikimate-3-phosphate synthase